MGNNEFHGIFPYLVTPLDERGRLKEQVLADLVNHLIRKPILRAQLRLGCPPFHIGRQGEPRP